MPPSQIIIIRHCDKPPDDDDKGLCNDIGAKRALRLIGYNPDTDSSTVKGTCLQYWGCNDPGCQNIPSSLNMGDSFWYGFLGLGVPNVISNIELLAPISKDDTGNSYPDKNKCKTSNRCCLILNPLSYLLKSQFNYNKSINEYAKNKDNKSLYQQYFCDDQGKELAQLLLKDKYFNDKIVVIAWEHKDIPNIINNILTKSKQIPSWPKNANDRFDLVFKLTRNKGSEYDLTIHLQGISNFYQDDKKTPVDGTDIPKPYDTYPNSKTSMSIEGYNPGSTQPSRIKKSTTNIYTHLFIIIGIILSFVIATGVFLFYNKYQRKK